MKYLIPFFAIIFFPAIALAVCSWNGNTGTLASPYDDADMIDCVTDAATKTGAVVIQIPNATVTWNQTITVNMQDVSDPAPNWTNVTSLTIKGQSDCTVDGNDIPTACGANITDFYLAYTGKEGKAFRLAHLEIEGTSGFNVNGNGKSWRADHIFWNTVTGYNSARVIWIGKGTVGWLTEGLIDHNYVLNWGGGGTFLHYQPTADGGNLEWMTGAELGTSHAIYVENSKISHSGGGRYVTDNNGASRWVIRYNEIVNAYIAGHDAQVGGFRGSLKLEAYNNTFAYDAAGNCYVIYRSGANGVFANNTITWTGAGELCGTPLSFANYRNDGAYGWPAACSNTSGKMTLAISTTTPATCVSGDGCIDTDGAAASPNGYPCRDQVGVSGNDPQVGGGLPFLFWNNTINGVDASSEIGVGFGATHIALNTDYCTHATTMPATCNGVSTTYAAYTYPHPLRGEADVTAPTISGLSPSGAQSCTSDPRNVTLQATTDEAATCRYHATATTWAGMGAMSTTGGTSHSQVVSVACNAAHSHNILCQDGAANESTMGEWSFNILGTNSSITIGSGGNVGFGAGGSMVIQ